MSQAAFVIGLHHAVWVSRLALLAAAALTGMLFTQRAAPVDVFLAASVGRAQSYPSSSLGQHSPGCPA